MNQIMNQILAGVVSILLNSNSGLSTDDIFGRVMEVVSSVLKPPTVE